MPPLLDIILVRAIYDYETKEHGRLSFKRNDVIQVLQMLESGWWDGVLNSNRGWFPSNFVSKPEKVKVPPQKKFGWVKKKSGNKRHLFFNTLTGETVVYEKKTDSTEDCDDFVEEYYNNSSNTDDIVRQQRPRTPSSEYVPALTVSSVISKDNEKPSSHLFKTAVSAVLPLHWGSKTTSDGRLYYYNMITNETTWDLKDIDSETGKLVLSKSPPPTSPSSQGSLVFNRSPLSSWESLRRNVQNYISTLKTSAKNNDKSKFLQDSTNIVQAIQQMLKISGTMDRESIKNKMVSNYHKQIMKSLSKLVLAAKKASSVWPPPDSVKKMVNESNDVMLAVRQFCDAAEEAGIQVNLIEGLDFGELGLSDGKENSIKKLQHFHYSMEEISHGLDSVPKSIGNVVKELDSFLQRRNRSSTSLDKAQLIQLTRSCVTEVGHLLSLLEDFDYSNIKESLAHELNSQKQELYESISGLVSTTTLAVDSMAPDDALRQIVMAANHVNNLTQKVVISAKYVLDEKNKIDEQSLQDKVGNVSNEYDVTPRRALSMSSPRKPSITALKREDSTLSVPNTLVSQEKASTVKSHSSKNSMISKASKDELVGIEEDDEDNMPLVKSKVSSSAPLERQLGESNDSSEKLAKFFGEEFATVTAARQPPTPAPSTHEDLWFLGDDIPENDVLVSMEGVLKGASLRALICKMTHHSSLDTNLTQTFLMTFHSFASTREVLKLLADRFNIPVPEGLSDEQLKTWQEKKQKPIRIRVVNIVKSWLDSFFYQAKDKDALNSIEKFVRDSVQQPMPNAADQLIKLIERRRAANPRDSASIRRFTVASTSSSGSKDLPSPMLPKNLKRIKLADLDPLELARQLTLMEWKVYSTILPYECLDKAWSEKDGHIRAPTIKSMILMTNQITGWVAETILLERDIRKRASLMKYFIHVGDKCRQLNNFNTLMAVLAALNSSPIHRLKRTKELLSSKTKSILEELKRVMQPAQNFSNYRADLRKAQPPCVPFLGLYLTDLTFIEDGNANNIKSMPHLINIDKRIKTSDKIREIQQYQQVSYQLVEVPEIQKFLKTCLEGTGGHFGSTNGQRDADELYQKSLQLEPREREDEKIARLLQESGFL